MMLQTYSYKAWVVFAVALIQSSNTLAFSISPNDCIRGTLEPCREHPDLPESILCENIEDVRIFTQVVRCGGRRNMQEIFLERSYIDYLPLYVLDFCGFFFLNVKSVVLNKLLEGNVLVRLQHLHLDNVTISTPWNWEPLSVLTKLLRFSVSNMLIQILDSRLVENLSENLQSLILTSTNTTSVEDSALARLTNMMYISVQNNEITELKRTMFPRPSKIKYFYFGKNKISFLPADLFMDMPELEIIGLQGNLISEISDNTFRRVWGTLDAVRLEGNPLKCDCRMLWLLKKGTPVDLFKGRCFAPKRQYGKILGSLRVSDFHCYS